MSKSFSPARSYIQPPPLEYHIEPKPAESTGGGTSASPKQNGGKAEVLVFDLR
jgi:hypothetical protein